ncbi:MAG: hypothetical protein KJ900_10085 [Proteobacteria bacterium]|nr:hypothetical protein [Desulfocapsa sp.]MBU3943351.1 hypothetical protein [Pseudomonadota bacterium]MCG2742672.1 hypothetical protein [Desulfobacteraceae bacterium]MBU4029849.1 hypothetical protein [Pseudomonadota bacterium]MBU4043227.1 hypothetical protein [Pseudomonadota bacterium]
MKLKFIGDAFQRIQNVALSETEAEEFIRITAQAAYDEVVAVMRQYRENEISRVNEQTRQNAFQAEVVAGNNARHEKERQDSLARTAKLKAAENVL